MDRLSAVGRSGFKVIGKGLSSKLFEPEKGCRGVDKVPQIVGRLAAVIAPRIDVSYVVNNPKMNDKVWDAIMNSPPGEFKEFKDELEFDGSLYALALVKLHIAIQEEVFERVEK